jgi:transposase
VTVHPDHLRRLLHRRRISWTRTVTSVAHKRRDQAADDAKVTELANLKQAPRRG